jgi:hypothetical protein
MKLRIIRDLMAAPRIWFRLEEDTHILKGDPPRWNLITSGSELALLVERAERLLENPAGFILIKEFDSDPTNFVDNPDPSA